MKTQDILTFELNRFPENELIAWWHKADKTKREIVIEFPQAYLSVEPSEIKDLTDEHFELFLQQLPILDNHVQLFAQECYQKGTHQVKDYLVSLSWISFEDGVLTMGYTGDYVNIELRVLLSFTINRWEITDLYYQ